MNPEVMYEEIKETRSKRDNFVKEVQNLDKIIEVQKLEYRIASVKRVLEHINDLCWKKREIPSNLIVHCLNKLNGNIDGTELNLGDIDDNN